MKKRRTARLWWLALLLLLAGCTRPDPVLLPLPVTTGVAPATGTAAGGLPTPTLANSPTPGPTAVAVAATRPVATPTTAALELPANLVACGQTLPLRSPEMVPRVNVITPGTVPDDVPAAARPALEFMLSHPGQVGLAAYRPGAEAEGAYLNPDTPMPLASVVKLIHLVAYVEALAQGDLAPWQQVDLSELERYYLPGTDLGAHAAALADFEADDRLFGQPPQLSLEDVVRMMVRYSANDATDYLHQLLGQEQIEATAHSLGLETQTAPCPFLGQFLSMNNHTRAGSDYNAVQDLIAQPDRYGEEVIALTHLFSTNARFREAELAARSRGGSGRGAARTQSLFSENLGAQASARDYARLMALIAQNGLSTPDASFNARRHLEWPMQFEVNQELFSNLGYKNGSLPGILTTVYYAYPLGETSPVVVALFFRELPFETYSQWRRTLAHDELARWLLADPAAITILRNVLATRP